MIGGAVAVFHVVVLVAAGAVGVVMAEACW
jgi:hypothetical protein